MRVKYIISIFLLIALLLLFSKGENNNTKLENIGEYPNEWMYLQRAYPNNYINKKAIQEAVQKRQRILHNRNFQKNGTWELKGPVNRGGRVTDVAISPDNNNHLYVATASGGLFKTTDKGQNWTPIFDAMSNLSIGNIAIAPSNAQRIYVGTGEANGTSNSGAFFGDGIYRSDDAGSTWSNVGLQNTHHTGRIVVDPKNENRVFVAATGKLYGKNTERGVYRSLNGGTNWEKVLYVSDSTAAIDMVMNPVDTDTLYAAMWDRIRQPWQRAYAGKNSRIHRSKDGGTTWELLGPSHGLPAESPETGRISLAISESNPSIVYARYTKGAANSFDGIYKSTDHGNTWTAINTAGISGVDATYGWFFGNLRVHPTNPDELYVLGYHLFRTRDSGTNWGQVTGMHVDHHALEYSRSNPNFILEGNDGGAYLSEDAGATWQHFTNLPITQFYNIEVDFLQPQRLYGGSQDNNTMRTTTGSLNDWVSILAGDGFHVNVDPTNSNIVYAEYQFGNLFKSTNGGVDFVRADSGINTNDRKNWNTPIVLSPFNSNIVYYGSHRLYSSNQATQWTAISTDLTKGQHASGSISYGTITAIAPSYLNLNTIYTGSDDGKVHVTFDGGQNWTDISSGLPNRFVTSIAISPTNDMVAYATFSGYSVLDYTPHIFKTTNGGQTWTDISSNLPSIPINDVVLGPNNIPIVATDLTVWYSENDGASWTILGANLPQVLVRDLKYHKPTNTLYAGTYGRSMYSFNMNQVLSINDEPIVVQENIHVFPVPTKGELTVKHSLSGSGRIAVFDITGREVRELHKGNLQSVQNQSYNVQYLAPGSYFLIIEADGKKVSRRIIKE